jgi:hypothetical protein
MAKYDPPIEESNEPALSPEKKENLQRVIDALQGSSPPLVGPHGLEGVNDPETLRGLLPDYMLKGPSDYMPGRQQPIPQRPIQPSAPGPMMQRPLPQSNVPTGGVPPVNLGTQRPMQGIPGMPSGLAPGGIPPARIPPGQPPMPQRPQQPVPQPMPRPQF